MLAQIIRHCFPVAADAVATRCEEINKLNVFPVPDGDTGTNMSLTLATVVREIEALPPDALMADVAHAITHGSLMGARGNSGVITSQILRGIAEGLKDANDAPTAALVASAFKHGKKVAFGAVRKPVEGTILTVISDLAEAAEGYARQRMDVSDMLTALVKDAYDSVARTPDLLPVLKENGVVDSGAFGFAIFFEAFVREAVGTDFAAIEFSTTVATGAGDASAAAMNRVHIELNDDWEGSEYRYCTEFLFKAANKDFDEPATLDFLATMGDCELLVGAWPEFKIHVHTNTPDAVLGHMLQEGQIFEVFIHNMDLEAHERTAAIAADKRGEAAGAQGAGAPAAPRKELGFVAVAAGEGQAEILTSLGVDYVVSGGQTMNPSTADILAAVEKVAAKHVVVLPNNSNIRMAAEAAAAACTSCEVAVVPTKTVLQAFAAMFVVDLDLPLEDNIAAMVEAIAEVRGGEVTTAVRDSQAATGQAIHAGDVIGIEDDAIYVVGKAIDEVALALINRMQEAQEGDTLTLLAGSDMSDEELAALVEKIEGAQPDLEVDAQRGDQPLYPLIFSIE